MPTNNDIPKYSQIATDAARETAKLIVGPLGGPAVDLVVRLGKDLIASNTQTTPETSRMVLERLQRDEVIGSNAPAIIGLGRCGCRVTASLAQMIAQARGNGSSGATSWRSNTLPSWLGSILSKRNDQQAYTLDPILVVGDLNANTFSEIRGILQSGPSQSFAERLLVLDYRPLAADGAGNIPVFGEFFTRGLLSLSPNWESVGSDWHLARSYLLEYFSKSQCAPKLAFYVFGAAGGSGSGSAMELLRSQRTLLAVTPGQSPRIYMSGIAVIPEDEEIDDHHLRNTGRLIVQYLADLDISLENEDDYARELQPKYGSHIRVRADLGRSEEGTRMANLEIPVPPWDSMGIVSNQVMNAIATPGDRQVKVDERANQYIAQQVFNLAYSQSAAEALQPSTDVHFDESTVFQAVKLDVEDLINGLCGPYAIGFSASETQALESEGGVDGFFVRSIGLPNLYPSKANPKLENTIQGISISPQRREKYSKLIADIRSKCDDAKGNQKALVESDFSALNEVMFFQRCPRIVVVLTSPANDQITSVVRARVARLCKWTFPNLKQARFATIGGTTPFYSLSIYMEGSVVHAYDVQQAIVSYLFSCWKQRSPTPAKSQAFYEQYKNFVEKAAPVTEEEVRSWLGEIELYGENISAWDKKVSDHQDNWLKFIEGLDSASETDKVRLRKHDVDSCMLTPKHVVSALRYINYMRHTGKIAKVVVADD